MESLPVEFGVGWILTVVVIFALATFVAGVAALLRRWRGNRPEH